MREMLLVKKQEKSQVGEVEMECLQTLQLCLLL